MKGNGHSVDGEVPPRQVLFYRAVGYLRKGAGPAVALRPCGHEVKGLAVHLHFGCRELGAGHHLAGQSLGHDVCHSLSVAHHYQVKVSDGPAQQHVADAAAHQVHGNAFVAGNAARRPQKFQLPGREVGL